MAHIEVLCCHLIVLVVGRLCIKDEKSPGYAGKEPLEHEWVPFFHPLAPGLL